MGMGKDVLRRFRRNIGSLLRDLGGGYTGDSLLLNVAAQSLNIPLHGPLYVEAWGGGVGKKKTKTINGYTVFVVFSSFFFCPPPPLPPRSVHTAARVRSLVLGLSGLQLQREAPMYLRIYLGKTPKTPKVASNRKLKNWGL